MDFFKPSEAHFSTAFNAHELAFGTCSRYAKTYGKPRFFLGFNHISCVAHKTNNDAKSLQEPVEQSFPQRSC